MGSGGNDAGYHGSEPHYLPAPRTSDVLAQDSASRPRIFQRPVQLNTPHSCIGEILSKES